MSQRLFKSAVHVNDSRRPSQLKKPAQSKILRVELNGHALPFQAIGSCPTTALQGSAIASGWTPFQSSESSETDHRQLCPHLGSQNLDRQADDLLLVCNGGFCPSFHGFSVRYNRYEDLAVTYDSLRAVSRDRPLTLLGRHV